MYKLDIRVDAKEAAATEWRRSLERDRQARIFNTRERTIGVDLGSLENQVTEKRQRELEERQRHEAFAQEMITQDKVVELLQQRQEKDLKQLNKNDSFWNANFRWRGLEYEKRRKLQQEQIREWTAAQTAEKEHTLQEEKHADRLYHLKACELDQRAVDLASADEDTRRNITVATKEYNLALGKEKAGQKQQEMAQEQDDNFTELCNHVHGDMLTENPAVAQSAFGLHRVIPDRWKGMSPRQVEEVRRTQEQQKLEKQGAFAHVVCKKAVGSVVRVSGKEMEEDEQSDDSSGSESELQERAEQLQAAVDGNPYHYDNHVQLIGLLRQLGDLDGARKARNAMSEAFPLTEGMWLGWIRDELPLVSIPEASLELRQLFERATEDYLSVEVWLQYVQFTMDQMSVVSEGVAFPRDVCERAIVRCGLHVSKAGELWDMYRGFEIALLKSLQEMQQNSTEDDNLKPQVEAQFERVDKLFKRQLAVPLIGQSHSPTITHTA
ncbi:RIB43A-like with coiled-coils protein 2, partial [Geodia barretti]